MPELPEVEVVRLGLAPALVGATITAVSVFDERSLKRHVGPAADFVERLEGADIDAVVRRGKFLWMPIRGRAEAIVGHLGMSGQLLLRMPDVHGDKHERIRLDIRHPDHDRLSIVFADQRIFGSLAVDALVETGDGWAAGHGSASTLVPTQVAHIARDALDPGFDDDAWVAAVRRRRSAIKRVLLDQTLVSGIGNIYADEALWAARIHPETEAQHLTPRALRRLLAEVRAVLHKALAEGGTSFDAQYVNVNGEAGYFAHSLNAYGRGGEPCPRCGSSIKRVPFAGRSSHFCTRCQRRR
ncbi:bifunctional DNA-formamidopyrimidine glycosylase/DNA-(apurinic or apyrimidinic site) lyase [Microbacterium sp. YY-01]|uniref:bifunctional DNA-formamidopyrimidine glycosylase/DNA-(apurinic or apyrimidinic site) lyase n=1 Tax=Microbacterium sp. YY-01 TaxID=3421634 RepID=UPI003D16CDB2